MCKGSRACSLWLRCSLSTWTALSNPTPERLSVSQDVPAARYFSVWLWHAFVCPQFWCRIPSWRHDKRKGLFCCYLGYSWYKNAHDQLLALGNVNTPNCYGSVQIMYAAALFSMSCFQQKAEWNKDTEMASSSDGSSSYIGEYLAHSPMPSDTVGRKAF